MITVEYHGKLRSNDDDWFSRNEGKLWLGSTNQGVKIYIWLPNIDSEKSPMTINYNSIHQTVTKSRKNWNNHRWLRNNFNEMRKFTNFVYYIYPLDKYSSPDENFD